MPREDFDLRQIDQPVYEWKDHGRYVEVTPVLTGWLVVWGHYEDLGRTKRIHGNRVYRDEAGVKRRLVDAVLAFTRKPTEARDALMMLNRRGGLPDYRPAALRPKI